MDRDFEQHAMSVLKTAAFAVIVCWGIRSASHLLSILLMSVLFAFVILPFPQWLMRRFRLGKASAVSCTVLFILLVDMILVMGLAGSAIRLKEKMPEYRQRFEVLHTDTEEFLSRHGVKTNVHTVTTLYGSERTLALGETAAQMAVAILSERILIWLLTVLFLLEMLEAGPGGGRLGSYLLEYGSDVQRFVVICATTGAITALANLVLLKAIGVDFALMWCVVYFFLHFIPNVGFLLSLAPPTFVALLTLGWKRALLVLGLLIVTEMLGDYVLQPTLMIKGLHVSMLEIMLSLTVWGFLLGPTGAILAVPLTLTMKRLFAVPREPNAGHAVA